MADSLDYLNIGLTSFVEARDPTASEVGAQLDQTFCNSSSGDHFVCIDDTAGAQQWQRTSDGVVFPNPILATDHPNLVAMYTMDNISGSTLNDESANGNNGTITGATTVAGKIDNALDFDNGDYVLSVYLDGSNGFAVCFWVNFDAVKSVSGFCNWLFNNWSPDGSNLDRQALCATDAGNSDKFTALFRTDSATNISVASTVTPTTGTYHFVCFGYDGSKGFISVDGENIVESSTFTLRAKVSESIVLPHRSITEVGGNADSIPVNGKVDQYRIFNRALTQAEITALANEV